MTIINWKARRSGASMTIEGFDEGDGSPVKLTGITEIGCEAGDEFPWAADADGKRHELGHGT